MYEDQFLFGGLRTRLERLGRVRPHTIRLEAVGQSPERHHPEVSFRPVKPNLQPRVPAMEPAHSA